MISLLVRLTFARPTILFNEIVVNIFVDYLGGRLEAPALRGPPGWDPDSDAIHRNRPIRGSERIKQPDQWLVQARLTASTETQNPTSSDWM